MLQSRGVCDTRTPVVCFALAVLALLCLPALLNATAYLALARAYRDREDCEEAPDGAAMIRACAADCAAAAVLLPGSLSRRRRTPREEGRKSTAQIVVLVSDRGLTARAHWRLQARLERAGKTVVPCPAAAGNTFEARVAALADCLTRLPAGTSEIVLLGIGTGGLVARHFLRRRAAPRVRRLFTIGCPHGGSTSRLARLCGWKEAAPDSPFVRQLAAADRLPDQFAITTIAADCDAWIVPPQSAEYRGAFNIRIRGFGHFTLFASRRTFELLLENLDA